MRTLTKLTMALALVLGLGLAGIPGDANALPSAQYTWIATSGTGSVGSNVISANIGDTLTLQIDVLAFATAGDEANSWSLSPTWDQDGNDVLDYMSHLANADPASWFDFSVPFVSESTPGTEGFLASFTEPANFNFPVVPAQTTTFNAGTVTFTVVNNGVSTINWCGACGAVAQSFVANASFVNNFLRDAVTATVNAPEPGTTAMLGLGLLGLVLGGRRK